MSYKTSNAEGHVDFINTYDLEPMAQQVIPKAAFGYIASGAEDPFTLRENIRAFNHKTHRSAYALQCRKSKYRD